MFSAEEISEIRRLADDAREEDRHASARLLEGLAAKLRAMADEPPAASRLELFEEVLPDAERGVEASIAAGVRRALERQEPIHIRYRANRDNEITTRRIRPFNIHFYNGREYVEAFCELRGSDRIFALENIEEIIGESTEAESPAAPDEARVPRPS